MTVTSGNSTQSIPTPIRELQTIDSLTASDKFAISQTTFGATMAITAGNMVDFFTSSIDVQTLLTFIAQPVTGFTYSSLSSVTDNIWLIISPTSTIATLTVTLPTSPSDQQEINVNTTQEVTALTLDGGSKSIIGIGIPVSLAQFSFFKIRYDISTESWYRIG
jgi:hypothetical protein